MRDRPEGITERDLARALADGWSLAPHRRTPGTEHAYQALDLSIAQLT